MHWFDAGTHWNDSEMHFEKLEYFLKKSKIPCSTVCIMSKKSYIRPFWMVNAVANVFFTMPCDILPNNLWIAGFFSKHICDFLKKIFTAIEGCVMGV